MPPKWKGGAGRDWSTCECRNCRWLWLDAVPRDVPELRDTVAWAAGSPFGANRLDVWHKQLHLLLSCAPSEGEAGEMLRASTQTRRLQYIDRLRTKQHELQAALELATANSREQLHHQLCRLGARGWQASHTQC